MPKIIRNRIYIHRQYAHKIISSNDLASFYDYAYGEIGQFEWNTLRLTKGKCFDFNEISFQLSEDFDTADEPAVNTTVSVPYDGDIVRVTKTPHLIFHHKWQWVEPDYKGFDYYKSKARSDLWKPFVNYKELCKIGNKNYWVSIRNRWEAT